MEEDIVEYENVVESSLEEESVCNGIEECARIGDELANRLYEEVGDFLIEEELLGEVSYDEEELVYYRVEGDKLVDAEYFDVDENHLIYQDDFGEHEFIWELFTSTIPLSIRKDISGFIIFTDGEEELLASVEPDEENLEKWFLSVDILDIENPHALTATLIHEYAHLLTLRKDQLLMEEEVVFADENDPIHVKAAERCQTYFVDGMGCSFEESFLNQFYKTFWLDINDEWSKRKVVQNEEEVEAFFDDHEDKFVTVYAATDPVEDIAETWMYFIFWPHPEGTEEWEQKIKFFYKYPDQVQLRAEILTRLLQYFAEDETD